MCLWHKLPLSRVQFGVTQNSLATLFYFTVAKCLPLLTFYAAVEYGNNLYILCGS